MNNINYFVRQKTIQVPVAAFGEQPRVVRSDAALATSLSPAAFKIVKLYAYTDETKRLQEPERREVDLSGEKELSDPYCRELLEVVVESNFNAGDYVLLFTFPRASRTMRMPQQSRWHDANDQEWRQKDDKTRKKELSIFLSRLSWVCHEKPTYVCCSERDADGELFFTVLLRSDEKLTDEALMKLCGKGHSLKVGRITRGESGLLILPDLNCSMTGSHKDGHTWSCSDNITRPVITVEDGVISTDDLKIFLQAKIGEDTTPVIRKMFAEWNMAYSRFTSFEYGEAGNPHIELRLVRLKTARLYDK